MKKVKVTAEEAIVEEAVKEEEEIVGNLERISREEIPEKGEVVEEDVVVEDTRKTRKMKMVSRQ